LQSSIDGETFEVNEMYPVYNNAAEFQGEKEAVRTTHYALEAEKIHAGCTPRHWIWQSKVRIMMPTRFSFAHLWLYR